MKKTAKNFGDAEQIDLLFPKIDLKKCRDDLRALCRREERLIPAWSIVFFLNHVKTPQFVKYNDRFRMVYDLSEEIDTSGDHDTPELVRESIFLEARKNDILSELYQEASVRLLYDVPVLKKNSKTFRILLRKQKEYQDAENQKLQSQILKLQQQIKKLQRKPTKRSTRKK